MISRWLICFSAAFPLLAGSVGGRVELRDSRDPVVKNQHDFSGVVVSLTPLQGPPQPLSTEHAVIKQKNKTFSPHVLAIPVGAYVDFPNFDPIFHNAFSSYSGQLFDVGLYPPGSSRGVRFVREGVVRVFCNIHSSMSAMIVVVGTPYFSVSRRDGSWLLPDVPPGEYELRVVHERSSEAELHALSRRLVIGADPVTVPVLTISEAGYLSIPHKNKYGRDYPPDSEGTLLYPGVRN